VRLCVARDGTVGRRRTRSRLETYRDLSHGCGYSIARDDSSKRTPLATLLGSGRGKPRTS
jgi:hypothetical protein